MTFSQPVDGPRIVPYGEDRLSTDVLPNGRPGFRQTQRFTDINPAFPDLGQHNASDVGNYHCGDAARAMGPGLGRSFQDNAKSMGAPTNAIGVKIQHSPDWTSEIWHLDSTLIPYDRWVEIEDQQQIGVIGDTGLGSVCHGHVVLRYRGILVDIFPRLRMNEEASVKVQGTWVEHIVNRKTSLRVNTRFREGPFEGAGIIHTFGKGTGLLPVVRVKGTMVGTSDDWYGCFLWYEGSYQFGFFHSSGLNAIVRNEAVNTGLTPTQVEAKIGTEINSVLSQLETSLVSAVKSAISRLRR